jgi:hypothetical protein
VSGNELPYEGWIGLRPMVSSMWQHASAAAAATAAAARAAAAGAADTADATAAVNGEVLPYPLDVPRQHILLCVHNLPCLLLYCLHHVGVTVAG